MPDNQQPPGLNSADENFFAEITGQLKEIEESGFPNMLCAMPGCTIVVFQLGKWSITNFFKHAYIYLCAEHGKLVKEKLRVEKAPPKRIYKSGMLQFEHRCINIQRKKAALEELAFQEPCLFPNANTAYQSLSKTIEGMIAEKKAKLVRGIDEKRKSV